MRKPLAFALGAVALVASGAAAAYSNVGFGISIGVPAPVYVAPRPPVAYYPAPAYYPPQAYVAPAPVYVAPPPPVYYGPPVYVPPRVIYRGRGWHHGWYGRRW